MGSKLITISLYSNQPMSARERLGSDLAREPCQLSVGAVSFGAFSAHAHTMRTTRDVLADIEGNRDLWKDKF